MDISDRGSILVVATVTWDLFGERRVAGGAASYIARACEALGESPRFLVPAGEDAPLEALGGHEIERVPAHTQTYRHLLEGDRRRLELEQAVGRTVRVADVPAAWREPKTVILAPLMPEDVDVAELLDEWPEAEVGLLAQGLQRVVLPEGRAIANRAQPSSVLVDAARPNVSMFLSDDEVRLWPSGAITHLAARCARVVVTDGARGATVYTRGGAWHIDAVPAHVVDATGAGDTFAATYILGLRESRLAGRDARAGDEYAGRLAAACAAAAVEVRGPAPLPSRADIERRMSEDGTASA